MKQGLGYIGLGANLGDRARNLWFACQRLDEAEGLSVSRRSPIYESAAHVLGSEVQPDYLNAIVEIRTHWDPMRVLSLCLNIEKAAGRERRHRWASRTLDIDLLSIGTNSCDEPCLHLPHPRLHQRRFVLLPWADLAPTYYIGKPLDTTVADLLAQCTDDSPIRKTELNWS